MKRALVAAMLLLLVPLAARGQGTCRASGGNANCTVGGTTAYRIDLQILRVVLMSLSSSGVALDAPGGAEFEAGFGQTTGPSLTVRSNSAWSVSARVTQPLWAASPAPARANKPAADLLWSTAAGGPFTAFSVTGTTVQAGAGPTAGTTIPLYFRVSYAWLLDSPGSYSIPVQLTITAP